MTVKCTSTAVRLALFLFIKMYQVKKIICAVKISTLEAELIEGFEIDGASVKIPIVGGKSSLWCL